MKIQQILLAIIISMVLISIAAIAYFALLPNDRCSTKDRETSNCVPAGKCGPTPEKDAVIECDVKNYDKKYNTSLEN